MGCGSSNLRRNNKAQTGGNDLSLKTRLPIGLTVDTGEPTSRSMTEAGQLTDTAAGPIGNPRLDTSGVATILDDIVQVARIQPEKGIRGDETAPLIIPHHHLTTEQATGAQLLSHTRPDNGLVETLLPANPRELTTDTHVDPPILMSSTLDASTNLPEEPLVYVGRSFVTVFPTTAEPDPVLDNTDKGLIQLRKRCPRFRILIIGKANAGKTTILQKMCNTTEMPIVRVGGIAVKNKSIIQPTDGRGIHNINNELTFSSNDDFVFHDSPGFEAGSVTEMENVREFIAV